MDTGVQRPIYMDYHATTPTDPRVCKVVGHYMTTAFGNASSVDHAYGDEAEQAVEVARGHVASLLGSRTSDVVFTSGASESVNLGIQGLARRARRGDSTLRIGLTPVEHSSVLSTCEALGENGEASITYFEVDRHARLDLEDLEAKCRAGLDLVCVMAANNEVGTLYTVQAVAEIAHRHGALFLSDATQAAGKVGIQFAEWDVDLMAISAHKMYGPKGVGALLIAPGVRIEPVLFGGQHQGGRRSGTLNVPGIAGLGEACRLRAEEMPGDELRIASLRDDLQALLQAKIPAVVVNGDQDARLAGNLHVSIPGIPNQAIVARIRSELAISTGAACSSGIEAPSHVLRAMGLPANLLAGALRFSLGKYSTASEVETAAELIAEAVESTSAALV